jgi:2-oxoisovalerate dehydrogenase E1 component
MASLWQAPILYVLENNRIAQTTPIERGVAGDIRARFEAFGIRTQELDSSDVCEIHPEAGRLLNEVRSLKTPRALILHTYRFGPHSKGDDTRDPREVERMRRERDPLAIHGARLSAQDRSAVESGMNALLEKAFQTALKDPVPQDE